MCLKIFCFLVLLVNSFSFAQNRYETKEEKLQQLKTRKDIKITETQKNILRLEYPNGKVLYKNISDYKYPESSPTKSRSRLKSDIQQPVYSPTYDSTIIDLTTIDTTLYYQKYSFWQEVPLGNVSDPSPMLVDDINNNKLPELYGQMKDYTSDYSDITVFEENEQGGFDSVYCYDSTNIAVSIFDVDKDGSDELHLRRFNSIGPYSGNNYLFFKKSNPDSLAKILSFNFYYQFEPGITQQNDNMFGDWDGDDFTDQIFHIYGTGIFVFEYNPLVPTFDSIYFYDYHSIDLEFEGFTLGDFDQDGKTEFLTGSVHGDVLSIENTGNNLYAPVWIGMVETYNAFHLGKTDDVDRNGKKEIWVMGDAFYNGVGITRITIFESDGNNSYQVVGRIDLVGIFSFNAGNLQAIDVDKDGVQEMMVCIDQTVLILKFNGIQNRQTYELFYFKQNDLALEGRNSVYYGATMYDLTNDGKEEIIINLDDVIENVGLRLFSFIYKPEFTISVDVDPNPHPTDFHLYANYPNPFNPTTKIKFDLPEYSNVSIKVYDLLGKEITTLLNKELSSGNYTIDWEAKDSNGKLLPSGVYLIRMVTDKYIKTIKAVLLK